MLNSVYCKAELTLKVLGKVAPSGGPGPIGQAEHDGHSVRTIHWRPLQAD